MAYSTKIYFFSMGCVSLFSPVFSEVDTPYEVNSAYGQGYEESSAYGEGYVRFEGRYRGGRGIDFKNGYASADLFGMPFFSDQIYPFVDFRWHYTGEKENAINIGLGTRYEWDEILLGANFFYDARKADHRDLQQIGVGLEGFLEQWDFRVNGYFPFKDSRRFEENQERKIEVASVDPEGRVTSVHIINESNANIYRTFTGVNLEVGRHFGDILWCRDIYIAALPYYYTEKKDNFFGGAVYLQSRVNQYISVDFEYSYDKHFRGRVSGQLTLSYPFGKGSEDSDYDDCYYTNRLFDRVLRTELIVFQKYRHKNVKKQMNVAVKIKEKDESKSIIETSEEVAN
jgi:hypothetical protein